MRITWCKTVIRIKFSIFDIIAVPVVSLLLFVIFPLALEIDFRLNMSFQTNLNSRKMTSTTTMTLDDFNSMIKLILNETVPLALPF